MKQYLDLMRLVRETGKFKADRTGTGCYSVFGRQMRFDLQGGSFPLVTTKRTHLKSIIHELLWFLQGDSNIRYLKANGVSIWDEWVKEGTKEYRLLTESECREKARKVLGLSELKLSIHYALPHESTLGVDEPHRIATDEDGTINVFINAATHPELSNHRIYDNPQTPDWFYRGLELLGVKDPHRELIAGELGPVYGTQWRSWPTVQRSHREVNMTIHERCVEANQHDDYFVLLGKAYAQQGDARAKALRELSDTFDRLGVPSVRREKDVETGGIDQIAKLVQQLTDNPDNRRLIVSAWNPAEVDEMALPPCHALFQFYTSELSIEERIKVAYDRELIVSKESWEDMSQGVAHVGLDTRGVPRRKLDCQLYQRKSLCAFVA